jgi:hypothetical protein
MNVIVVDILKSVCLAARLSFPQKQVIITAASIKRLFTRVLPSKLLSDRYFIYVLKVHEKASIER